MNIEIRDDWDDVLSAFPDEYQDIYFTKRYLGLYEEAEKKAQCVICAEDEFIMIMPFIRGVICNYYDFETAYGYGGPVANTDDIEWCTRAFREIHDFLKEKSYLCGFTRFHPLLNNERLVSEHSTEKTVGKIISVLYDRQTIAIDTSVSPDEIWTKQLSSKNRNMIRKAEKNGLEYKTEFGFESYDEFIDLYQATMKRLEADDFYNFEREYYDKLKTSLKGNSFLGTVRLHGKLICAAVFMYSKYYGHYHLEGSDHNYSSLGANNLLLWKVACEMHELGIHVFHLGGGTSSSPDDTLYKFKKAFSKNEKTFYIGKQIFMPTEYEAICTDWVQKNSAKAEVYGNRLLKYRY